MLTFKNIIIAITFAAVLGLGVNAFAHGGMGWSGGWGHHGSGRYNQGGYGTMHDSQMSRDEYRQFEQKREAFFGVTADIRTRLSEKEGDLQGELAKSDPDSAKASLLQKEISVLQAQFDQKRIDYMVEMKKLNPNVDRGFRSEGRMLGYGSSRGVYCWK